MKKEGKKGETGSNEQKDREHIKNRKANNKDTQRENTKTETT